MKYKQFIPLGITLIIVALIVFGSQFLPKELQLGGTTLKVPAGGTGATTFTAGQCIVGNGTGALTSQSCGSGGGSGGAWTIIPGGIYNTTSTDNVMIGETSTSTNAQLEVGGRGTLTVPYASSTAITATTFYGALVGNSGTATALAANGSNCSAGQYPLGVDASGAAETCQSLGVPFWTYFSGTTTDALAQGSVNLYNQTHTGEVTGATALTIASNIVDEDNLKMSTSPTNNFLLVASSSATGGMDWIATSSSLLNFGTGGSYTTFNNDFDVRLSATTTQNNLTTLLGLVNASTTQLTVTDLFISGDQITDFVGTGLTLSGTTLTLNATGDWTGTIDTNNFAGGAIGAGELLYGSAASTISELAAGTSGYILMSGGTGAPSWVSTSTFFTEAEWLATTTHSKIWSLPGLGSIGSSTATTTALGNLSITGYLNVAGTAATSTFANGIQLSGGCFRTADGNCVTGTGGTGTVGTGAIGQIPYYAAAGTTLTATSTISISTNQGITFGTGAEVMRIASSTGYVGIGTTSPYAMLSVAGDIVGRSFTATTTATSTFINFSALNGAFTGLASCDTIDTDSGGYLKCGSDAGGSGTFPFTSETNYGLTANSTTTQLWLKGTPFSLTASSTVVFTNASTSQLTVSGTATSTFAGGISTNLLRVLSTTASSTFSNGINLTNGCFAINGTCTGAGSGATTLDELTDVTLGGLAWGDMLYFDSADLQWKDMATSSIGFPTNLNGLSDVVISSVADAQILVYTGTPPPAQWNNVSMSGNCTIDNAGAISCFGGSIGATDMAAEDFGSFSCTGAGGGCTVDANAITSGMTDTTVQDAISASWPITLTGAAVGFNGLSTSTAAVIGGVPYFSGANTFANRATTTLTGTYPISITNSPIVFGASGAVISFPATSTMYGTGSYGNFLMWNTQPTWTATSTLTRLPNLTDVGTIAVGTWNGTSILPAYGGTGLTTGGLKAASIPFGNGTSAFATSSAFQFVTATSLLTITNASSTLLTASYASSTSYYGAGLTTCTTGKVTWSGGQFGCGTDATGGGGTFPFSADTNYGVQVYSTSTPTLWFKSGFYASSTSIFTNASTSQLTVSGTTWFTNGNVGIGTTTPGSLLSVQGIANFTTATSTFYGNGINLEDGCFAVNGVCVGGSSYTTFNTDFDIRLSATTTLKNLTTLIGLTNASSTLLTATQGWITNGIITYSSSTALTSTLLYGTNAILTYSSSTAITSTLFYGTNAAITYGSSTAWTFSGSVYLPSAFGGRSLTIAGAVLDADVELYTITLASFNIGSSTMSTTTGSFMQKLISNAATITSVFCSTNVGTSTIMLEERDPADPNTAGTDILFAGGLRCGSGSGQTASSTMANTSLDANDIVNLEIIDAAPVGGTKPTIIRIFVKGTFDD